MNKYDVIIVGGGPAGISCAYALGRAGIKTLIVDKKPKDKIGDKVCGDALHPHNYNEVHEWTGLPLPKEGDIKEHIDFALLETATPDSALKIPDKTTTVDRLSYGQTLLNATLELDTVDLLPKFKLLEVIVEENTVKGLRGLTKDGEVELRSKVVMDASGAQAVVRARLPESMCTKFPRKIPMEEILVAYREIIRTKEEHNYQKGIYLIYDPSMEDVMPGYYWIFSRGPKELNVGLGYFKRPENRGKDIRKMNDDITKKYFSDYEVLDSRGASIPARLPLYSLVHNGFITAGDAGALVNPLNGEGHGPALQSGAKAGLFLVEALKKGDVSERGLWDYNKYIWGEYGVKHAIGIGIIKFIDKEHFEGFDFLIRERIISQADVEKELGKPDAKPTSWPYKMMKMMKRPNVIKALWKTYRLQAKVQKLAKNYPDTPDQFDKWYAKIRKIEETKF